MSTAVTHPQDHAHGHGDDHAHDHPHFDHSYAHRKDLEIEASSLAEIKASFATKVSTRKARAEQAAAKTEARVAGR